MAPPFYGVLIVSSLKFVVISLSLIDSYSIPNITSASPKGKINEEVQVLLFIKTLYQQGQIRTFTYGFFCRCQLPHERGKSL